MCIIFLAAFLTGCEERTGPTTAVVDRVQIQCRHAGEMICRSYVEEGQIRSVLDCLRLYKTRGTAQTDPERILGDVFEIRVHLTDGSERIYRYRGGQYLSKDSHVWQKVDPEQGKALYSLLWRFI